MSKTQVCDGELDARVCEHNARGYIGAMVRTTKCRMHKMSAAQISPKRDVHPQGWCARDIALSKIGVK